MKSLKAGKTEALVDDSSGQLVSLKEDGVELMHPGGRADYEGNSWRASEIVCFPIFGPVEGFEVAWNGQTYDMDQHGLSRALSWRIQGGSDGTGMVLDQFYRGDPIDNPKASKEGHPATMTYIPFQLRKILALRQHNLTALFTVVNHGTEPMAYNFGWHPSFQLQGGVEQGVILDVEGKTICSLEDVLESPGHVKVLPRCNEVKYQADGETRFSIWTPPEQFQDYK